MRPLTFPRLAASGAREAAKLGLDAAQSRAEESAAAAASSSSAGGRPNGGPVTDQWREALERHLSGAAAAWAAAGAAVVGGGGGGGGGGASGPGVEGSGGSTLMSRRHLMDVDTFQLPNQSNLLALVFDPLGESCGGDGAAEPRAWLGELLLLLIRRGAIQSTGKAGSGLSSHGGELVLWCQGCRGAQA